MAILTNWTRLFLMSEGEAKFLHAVLPWRIMWHGGKERVILRERISNQKNFLQDFPHDCTLDWLGGKTIDVEDRQQGIWLYRLRYCQVNRSWIPEAGAFSPDEMGALTYWVEIDCKIWTMMEDLREHH